MPPIRVLLPVDAVATAQAAKQDIYGNTAGRDKAEGSVLQAASDRVAEPPDHVVRRRSVGPPGNNTGRRSRFLPTHSPAQALTTVPTEYRVLLST
ncbi:hypothetical protein DIPPA_08522 [Diplonema papillatum]|nr:hypothetical protein DIPPA_08522 [Diplonema papillatum]